MTPAVTWEAVALVLGCPVSIGLLAALLGLTALLSARAEAVKALAARRRAANVLDEARELLRREDLDG